MPAPAASEVSVSPGARVRLSPRQEDNLLSVIAENLHQSTRRPMAQSGASAGERFK